MHISFSAFAELYVGVILCIRESKPSQRPHHYGAPYPCIGLGDFGELWRCHYDYWYLWMVGWMVVWRRGRVQKRRVFDGPWVKQRQAWQGGGGGPLSRGVGGSGRRETGHVGVFFYELFYFKINIFFIIFLFFLHKNFFIHSYFFIIIMYHIFHF